MGDDGSVHVSTLLQRVDLKQWQESEDGQRSLVAYQDGVIFVWVPVVEGSEWGLKVIYTDDRPGKPKETLLEIVAPLPTTTSDPNGAGSRRVSFSGEEECKRGWKEKLKNVREIVLGRTAEYVALVCPSDVFVAKLPVRNEDGYTAKIKDVKQLGQDVDLGKPRVLGVRWHSLCRYQSSLLVLTSDNSLRLYDLREAITLPSGWVGVPSAQQKFQLPHSGSLDTANSTVGGVALDLPRTGCTWTRMCAYVLMGGSTVCVVCPVLPKESLVPEEIWNQIREDINARDDNLGRAWMASFEETIVDAQEGRPLVILRKRGVEPASTVTVGGGMHSHAPPYPRTLYLHDSGTPLSLNTPCAIAVLADEPPILAAGSANGDMVVGWFPDYIFGLWDTQGARKGIQGAKDVIISLKFDLTYDEKGSMVDELQQNGVEFCPADFDTDDMGSETDRQYPTMSITVDPIHPDRLYVSHCLGVSTVTVTFIESLLPTLNDPNAIIENFDMETPEDQLVYSSLPGQGFACHPTMGVCPIMDSTLGYKLLVASARDTTYVLDAVPLTHTRLVNPDDEQGAELMAQGTDTSRLDSIKHLLTPAIITSDDYRKMAPTDAIKTLQAYQELRRKDTQRMAQGVDRLKQWREGLVREAGSQQRQANELAATIQRLTDTQNALLKKASEQERRHQELTQKCRLYRDKARKSDLPLSDEERAYLRELLQMKKQLQRLQVDDLGESEQQARRLKDQLQRAARAEAPNVRESDRRVKEMAGKLNVLNVDIEKLTRDMEGLKVKADKSQEEHNWEANYDMFFK
eukprot:comp21858_c1_seq1/m.31240 comp21858_c1_seq1/g.31240  ORF comp21858_c1_seq1/g.31240 comp21858_c1_seq1/m.31240 type:complete len:801 (-) comp21858_c1_seq1:68-2470(-)